MRGLTCIKVENVLNNSFNNSLFSLDCVVFSFVILSYLLPGLYTNADGRLTNAKQKGSLSRTELNMSMSSVGKYGEQKQFPGIVLAQAPLCNVSL